MTVADNNSPIRSSAQTDRAPRLTPHGMQVLLGRRRPLQTERGTLEGREPPQRAIAW